ncbi:alpha/beta hydrolase [Nonomuraea pusilla]|uniref:alpha/beta hydrolase n=1 Tax=Nonomuraea pusilla TaxID=46177 RepID=UPI0006E2E1BB|nr:alpha/beta hydrolase [Nonomuraea pusilla]
METTFVLVHSPAVGPETWAPAATALERRGHRAVVPDLTGVAAGPVPSWPRAVEAVRSAAPAGPLVLVAHSNAGHLLPAVKEGLGGRVVACVFAEAHLPPAAGLVKPVAERFLPFLRRLADHEGVLPRWTDWRDPAEVAALLPDPETRERVVSGQPRLPLGYFTQPVPVPAGWDDVRCSFLWYGPPYDEVAAEARQRGWTVARVPGGHLHQVVAPDAVAEALVRLSLKS